MKVVKRHSFLLLLVLVLCACAVCMLHVFMKPQKTYFCLEILEEGKIKLKTLNTITPLLFSHTHTQAYIHYITCCSMLPRNILLKYYIHYEGPTLFEPKQICPCNDSYFRNSSKLMKNICLLIE